MKISIKVGDVQVDICAPVTLLKMPDPWLVRVSGGAVDRLSLVFEETDNISPGVRAQIDGAIAQMDPIDAALQEG